jgi:hypothetical protein
MEQSEGAGSAAPSSYGRCLICWGPLDSGHSRECWKRTARGPRAACQTQGCRELRAAAVAAWAAISAAEGSASAQVSRKLSEARATLEEALR